MENSDNILFTLTVNKQDNPSAEDKALCDELAAQIGQSTTFSLDISVTKKVGDAEAVKVDHLDGNAITVAFDVPAELTQVPADTERTFYLIRVHHAKAEQLPATVENGKISFQSDKFSTYALAYQETASQSESGTEHNQNTSGQSATTSGQNGTNAANGNNGSTTSAKTGVQGNDNLNIVLALAGLALVIGAAAFMSRRNKENQ